MKKVITLILTAGMLCTIAGCVSKESQGSEGNQRGTEINSVENPPIDEHGRRDTPVRVGQEGILTSSYAEEYTLDSAIEVADIIADITIIEWLGECEEGGFNTFFLAKVNKTLKGKHFEEIEIIQTGGSEFTIPGFPLFKNGDRFLAFLRRGSEQNEDKYWANRRMILDILEHDNTPYLVRRGGWLDQKLMGNDDIQKIEGNLKRTVNEEFIKHDPVLAEIRGAIIEANRDVELEKFIEENRNHRDIFNYYDVVKLVVKMAKEGERQ